MPHPARSTTPTGRQSAPTFSSANRHREHRASLAVGLLVSGLVHAAVFLLPLPTEDSTDIPIQLRDTVPTASKQALYVLNLRVTPIEPTPALMSRTPTTEHTPSLPYRGSVHPSPAAPHDELPRTTPALRLRPQIHDPVLWGRSGTPTLESGNDGTKTLYDRTRRLGEESDGVRIPPGEDMNTWTARDGTGQRWGVSPGMIHLGTATIPLCAGNFDASDCGFGISPAFRDGYRSQLRTRIELRRQAQGAALQDRARAIRARLDSLRDSIPMVYH